MRLLLCLKCETFVTLKPYGGLSRCGCYRQAWWQKMPTSKPQAKVFGVEDIGCDVDDDLLSYALFDLDPKAVAKHVDRLARGLESEAELCKVTAWHIGALRKHEKEEVEG